MVLGLAILRPIADVPLGFSRRPRTHCTRQPPFDRPERARRRRPPPPRAAPPASREPSSRTAPVPWPTRRRARPSPAGSARRGGRRRAESSPRAARRPDGRRAGGWSRGAPPLLRHRNALDEHRNQVDVLFDRDLDLGSHPILGNVQAAPAGLVLTVQPVAPDDHDDHRGSLDSLPDPGGKLLARGDGVHIVVDLALPEAIAQAIGEPPGLTRRGPTAIADEDPGHSPRPLSLRHSSASETPLSMAAETSPSSATASPGRRRRGRRPRPRCARRRVVRTRRSSGSALPGSRC